MARHREFDSKKLRGGLFCAAWLEQYCIVGGGGGEGRHGIRNKLYCLQYVENKIGEVLAEVDFGSEAPRHLLVAQDSQTLIVALMSGRLALVNFDANKQPPVIEQLQGSSELDGLASVKSCNLSANGRVLGLGMEDSSVEIRAWPSLSKLLSFRCGETEKDAVKDLAFSSSHNNKILATVHENGSCKLWELVQGTLIETVRLPETLLQMRPSFSKVEFVEDTLNPTFITAVNAGKQSFVLRWEQDLQGEVTMANMAKQEGKTTISALAVSPNQEFIGLGSGDGDMTIFSTETWKSVRRIKGAHMVFTTDVAFSQDSKSFLSVSADSSLCTCSFPRRPPSFRMNVWILSTLVLLVALLAWPHAWPLMEEWVASQL